MASKRKVATPRTRGKSKARPRAHVAAGVSAAKWAKLTPAERVARHRKATGWVEVAVPAQPLAAARIGALRRAQGLMVDLQGCINVLESRGISDRQARPAVARVNALWAKRLRRDLEGHALMMLVWTVEHSSFELFDERYPERARKIHVAELFGAAVAAWPNEKQRWSAVLTVAAACGILVNAKSRKTIREDYSKLKAELSRAADVVARTVGNRIQR